MKSFNQYIEESRSIFVKGWTQKNKIISVTGEFHMYHIKQVVLFPRKFGLNKNKILKILEDVYDGWSAPDPEKEAQQTYEQLENGVMDNQEDIESYLYKKGYCSFVIDKTHGRIFAKDEKTGRESAQLLDDNYLPFERSGFKLFEIKSLKDRDKYITSKYDWYNWLKGKKERKYVSKMAQFREAVATYPASYEKNPILKKLVDKHDDPLKFVLDVITHMSKGKLRLRRIGVANTREVVAFWNSRKKRQIKPSYVTEMLDDYFINEGAIKSFTGFFKDTRRKIDMRGWKAKVHHGKHPDVPQANKNATILFAVNPKTGEEEFIAFGKLDGAEITKLIKMSGLRK
jgi:hypothetical protein